MVKEIWIGDLEGYCKRNNIKNVVFKGEFKNEDKPEIYRKIDFINAIYGNKSLEVTTALPNRLYDGILFKKPIIASKGTYLGEVVDKYKLGIVVNVNDMEELVMNQINMYIRDFNNIDFFIGCNLFSKDVFREQSIFMNKIKVFILS